MTPDSEGVHEIANTRNPHRKADIVFVHGLGGGSHSTWRYGKNGEMDQFFWPEKLGEKLTDYGVWSLGYAAGMGHWFSEEGLAIDDRAANLALKLASKQDAGFGSRPLIFITHSMGGLVVKEFVTGALSLGGQDWNKVAQAVKGIVFLGTPHHGSHMASIAKGFSLLLRTQEHLKQMQFAGPALDKLHRAFVKWQSASECRVESYIETRGIARTGLFGLKRLLPRVLVVPRISGDPRLANCDCHPIPADHITLVKPSDPESDVYVGVLRFIEKALKSAATSTPHTVAAIPSAPPVQSSVVIESPRTNAARIPVDISRIIKYAPAELIGREAETALLDDAWMKVRAVESPRPHVLTFVALGGEGKTSLVAKWAAGLAHQDWPGCDAVFAWSFYSQGTREQTAVSSDLFLAEALTFFGDAAMAGSAAGAFDKGRRLAQLVGDRRALLILDGLEPLQYAPTSPTPGELKDQGLSAVLKGLAATSHGLCIVTTRYSLPDLKAFAGKTVVENELQRLSREAGVLLLKTHGVTGSDRGNIPLGDGKEMVSEFEKLVEDVDGHALTLHIMGSFLKKAFRGDIRCRDRVTIEKASQKTDDGHAFRAMAAYAKWMEDGSDEAKRELAILRLMGLFDRPATADCLQALLENPPIPGLTEPLVGLPEDDWNCSLDSLETAKLITVNREASAIPHSALRIPHSLDAHPLLREYFARRVREQQPEAWRAAHRRLYEHLCATTPDKPDATLEDLQPLYQAVAHGCQAGLQQEAFDVYWDRIQRGDDGYGLRELGALGHELQVLDCFFDTNHPEPSENLVASTKALVLGLRGARLRALGRTEEAVKSLDQSVARYRELPTMSQWLALRLRHLTETLQPCGRLDEANGFAQESVEVADRSGNDYQRFTSRCILGALLHHQGSTAAAMKEFEFAEEVLKGAGLEMCRLYSLWGFRYHELLLDNGKLQDVLDRVMETKGYWESGLPQKDPERGLNFLGRVLEELSEAKAKLGQCREQEKVPSDELLKNFRSINDQLTRAGRHDFQPYGLLAYSSCLRMKGRMLEAESNTKDAWELAIREEMRVFQVECWLESARLFLAQSPEGLFRVYITQSIPVEYRDRAVAMIENFGDFVSKTYRRRESEYRDIKQRIENLGGGSYKV